MICIRYRTLFSEKGALRCAPLLKTTLGRKKTTKSENSEISPSRCALWVHILVRPFWGSEALIYMFNPHQYHVLSIKSTEDVLEFEVPNFQKMDIFRYVFTRKKQRFLSGFSNRHNFLSSWSQKLRSKYDIDGIWNIKTHQVHPTVCAHTRHTATTFNPKKSQFSTNFDQVLFLVGVRTGARTFRKRSPNITSKSYFDPSF